MYNGKLNENVAPFSSKLFWAQMRPPWASIIFLAMNKPRPVPWVDLVTNLLNSRGKISSSIPFPLSLIDISRNWPSSFFLLSPSTYSRSLKSTWFVLPSLFWLYVAEIIMDSPSENLIALFIRFERTSKILTLSANTVIGSSLGSNTISIGVDKLAWSEFRFVLVRTSLIKLFIF